MKNQCTVAEIVYGLSAALWVGELARNKLVTTGSGRCLPMTLVGAAGRLLAQPTIPSKFKCVPENQAVFVGAIGVRRPIGRVAPLR